MTSSFSLRHLSSPRLKSLLCPAPGPGDPHFPRLPATARRLNSVPTSPARGLGPGRLGLNKTSQTKVSELRWEVTHLLASHLCRPMETQLCGRRDPAVRVPLGTLGPGGLDTPPARPSTCPAALPRGLSVCRPCERSAVWLSPSTPRLQPDTSPATPRPRAGRPERSPCPGASLPRPSARGWRDELAGGRRRLLRGQAPPSMPGARRQPVGAWREGARERGDRFAIPGGGSREAFLLGFVFVLFF